MYHLIVVTGAGEHVLVAGNADDAWMMWWILRNANEVTNVQVWSTRNNIICHPAKGVKHLASEG